LRRGDLYDVTVTALGAYPAADSGVARALAYDYARAHGLDDGQALLAAIKRELLLARYREK
jgi:hypothetical protein